MVYRVFTTEEKQNFATCYANGFNLKDIAEAAGVSIPTMAKYIRAAGGVLRKPGVKSNKTGDAMKIVEQVNEIMAKANLEAATEVIVREEAARGVPVTQDADGAVRLSYVAPVRKIMSFE